MKWQNHATIVGILAVCALCIYLIYDFNTNKFLIQLGLDLRSGSHIAVELHEITDPDGNVIKITQDVQERSMQVFRKRLDPDGNREVVITPEGLNRLIIEIPEVTDLAEAEKMVKKAGRLEFKEQEYDPSTGEAKWTTRLDGSAVKRAWASLDSMGGSQSWRIDFEMTSEGTRKFADLTKELTGKPLGIFFDGEEISAPNVNEPITGGSGYIHGSFTKESALELANYLNAGALPVDVTILESYTVSPTLGAESLRSSLRAGACGLLLVLIYMLFYYRMLGVVAGAALIVYALIVLASMNIPGLKFVLTLPGIAGFILSIGMAVDANVLIFERIREEMHKGKSLSLAVDLGFEKAFSSILDGHVTTFMGAAILFWLGSASIKGFGLTLMLGTAWSMITAIFVTKHFLMFCMSTLGIQGKGLYGG
ncbi:MAG: protein translocase subunit SecD [Vulcanimicrobiota bacterium]